MTEHNATRSMFDPALLRPAIVDSFKKAHAAHAVP